jgi:hypothetical protein
MNFFIPLRFLLATGALNGLPACTTSTTAIYAYKELPPVACVELVVQPQPEHVPIKSDISQYSAAHLGSGSAEQSSGFSPVSRY